MKMLRINGILSAEDSMKLPGFPSVDVIEKGKPIAVIECA